MRALPLGTWGPLWARQRLPRTLRLHFQIADARLQFQQLQLRVAELFARWTVLLDALPPEPLFQHLDLEIGPVELPLQFGYFRRVIGSGLGRIGDRDGQKQL